MPSSAHRHLRLFLPPLLVAGLLRAQELPPVSAVAASTNAPPAEAYTPTDPVFQGRMYRAMRQADELAGQGDWKQATDILLGLLEKAPENPLLIEKTALILAAQERWTEALDQWQHLFAKAQSRYDLLVRMGRCQALLDRREDASRNLLLASRLSPEPLEARLWLVAVQMAAGEADAAARTLGLLTVRETAVLTHWLSSDMRPLRQVLGTPLYLDLVRRVLGGGADGAKDILSERPEPAWAKHLADIAFLLSELEQRMEARESDRADELWMRARDHGVTGPLFEAYRAMILARTQGREAGEGVLKPLVERHADFLPLRHLQGVLLLEQEAFDDAVVVLREAAHASNNRTDIVFGLACALAGAGKLEESFILLNSLAGRDPNRLYRLLLLEAKALDALRLSPEFSDLMERLRPVKSP